MDDHGHSTERRAQTGYTAVLCDTCDYDDALPVLDALGNSVRRSPHGVLVRTPCQLGQLWCRSRKKRQRTNGPILLVQPCDARRKPLGTVVAVGPIRTPEDLRAVTQWLESSPTSAEGLPARLHQQLPNQGPAARN